ncbi:MAG: family 78 glycoside hydrolase catalytic domain [Firmicutes bacterium]|nr:family 78 glycoside hydrolase catalytic domain [Bacillota bacterium]
MEKVWRGKWIGDPRFAGLRPLDLLHKQLPERERPGHREGLKNLHMLVRKRFVVKDPIHAAYLDISGDDYYKLYINGRFVGQGPAPGYHFHYNYNRYEVAEFLKSGANVIAVHLYYQGLTNRVWNSGDYRQGMIAELYVNDQLALWTDGSWKQIQAREFTGGEVTGYETQYLEHIDARLQEKGWRDPDYCDDHWRPVAENPHDDHRLFRQITPTLQIYPVRPQIVKEFPGYYLIDFGQEIAGQFQMEAQGPAGAKLEIRCGEELLEGAPGEEAAPRVRYQMRCNCTYREEWTLSGGRDRWEPYDYKAFRYVEVIDPAHAADPQSFRAVVRHYPFDEGKCRFESSSPLLNAIWGICKNGVKYGCQEGYLDCPSREKGQYLGDLAVTAPAQFYLTGDLRLYKKALSDFACSAEICPGMMAVAPGSLMQEIADYSLLWPLLLLKYYWHSGDLEFLGEMYPVAEGLLAYFQRYRRPDGLLENVKDKWNLVDWPANLRDGYDFDLSQPVVGDGCHNVINALYLGAVKVTNQVRDILNIEYDDKLPQLEQAFINAFFDVETGLFRDSTVSRHSALHSNSIPLFYGLVPDKAVPNVVGLIRRKRLNCGVLHAYFLLKGLARAGEYRLVYDLLTGEDEHSWANMLREGATACFEVWGKEQKWNTSLLHPWASAPIPVLIEDIIGLGPAKPGWEEISFRPHLPETLEELTLEITSPKGRIRVEAKGINNYCYFFPPS